MRLTIGRKISLGFLIMLALVVVISSNTFISQRLAKEEMETIEHIKQRMVLAMEIDSEFKTAVSGFRGYMAYNDPRFFEDMQTAINNALRLEHELHTIEIEAKKPEIQNIIAATERWRDGALKDLAPLVQIYEIALKSGDFDKAETLRVQALGMARGLTPMADQVDKALTALVDEDQALMNESLNKARTSANKVMIVSLIVALVALVVGGAVSLYLIRTIRRPIQTMVDGANRYAEGDWRKAIELHTDDELGDLAQSLTRVQGNLNEMIKQVKESALYLNDSSHQVATAAEQSAQGATQVAEAINSVAQGADRQVNAVHDATAVVQQLSAGIQQVAANAHQVARDTEKTAEAAKGGGEAIEAAIAQIGNVERTVTHSAQVVSKLGERSKQIGAIIDTITGIAGQTNLLALNAAIEAARAGELGRGFAVVADEVRKLAEQSESAAQEIATLIGEIQRETDTAVQAMNSGAREVKVGTEVVNQAGESFQAIAHLILGVTKQVADITAAIQEMANGSQQIVRSVDEISQISKETAYQTQNVSAVTEEQSASFQEIAASSQSLAKMAEQLQRAVEKFVI